MGRAFEYRKARKFARWNSMSKTFTRLGKEISMAVKEGGPDPDVNNRLRAVIQNAKAANMPKDTVEKAIKKASDKDQTGYKLTTFEGYGPHGVAFLIETATDNNNRTVANVRAAFNKCGGSLGTSGSVEYMFDHHCSFKIKSTGISAEELELEVIDHGAFEVFEEEEDIVIFAEFTDYGGLQSFLESQNYDIVESSFEWVPKIVIELQGEALEEVHKLQEKLEDDEDVLQVYTTLG